ncbi:MAG TPA: hypothetical protein VED01_26055 [Burkholderiales bacterium]|nr:hypothetical protein [Burkholderiales bacterium]
MTANRSRNSTREHDQDSDPPRTAVPPDSPTTPGQPTSDDPARDQDSDPPRTPVLPTAADK